MEGILIPLQIVLVLLAVIVIVIYNRMVKRRNNVESAWANIDVQLQRRFDLIPNLVETVKGYAAHEKETFARITELRQDFQKATSPKEIGVIDQKMTAEVKHLFAVAEGYPDLKASQNFLMLQESLAGTENRIAYSRNNYNQTVMSYNTVIQTIPGVLFAKPMGFGPKEFFEIDEPDARDVVDVQFK